MLLLFLSVSKFLVTPPKLEIVSPGGDITEVVSVYNLDKTHQLRIKAYTGDWFLSRDGKIMYEKSGKLSLSCSPWITINPAEFNVPPDGKVDVRITVSVPDTIKKGHWGVVFFESVPIPGAWVPTIRIAGRIGLTVYVSPGNVSYMGGEITSLNYSKDTVEMGFLNNGDIWLKPKLILRAIKPDGSTIVDSTKPVLVLPGYQRILKIPFSLKKGDYTLQVDVDYGGSEILRAEKTIKVR